MKWFLKRRLNNFLIFSVLLFITISVILCEADGLHDDSAFLSGWILLAGVIVLTLFNARKKLPFLRLIKVAPWLQFHLYAGVFILIVFFFHIDFTVPQGGLDVLLATLFALATLSGFVGVVLSRWISAQLANAQEEVVFERIPGLVLRAKEAVEDLVLQGVEASGSTTLDDFYRQQLSAFFARPNHIVAQVLQRQPSAHELLQTIDYLSYSVSTHEQKMVAEIADWIKIKQRLDWQYARQGILKYWLFVHIPVAYTLLVILVLHVIVVHAFSGIL